MPPQDVGTWHAFENLVANLFRAIKVKKVSQNVSLAGHQIDIYLEEETGTGQTLRTAVECKYHKNPVGKDIVTRFSLIVDFLKKKDYVDRGILISNSGYTKEAYSTAQASQINLLKIEDLEASASKYGSIPKIVEKSEKARPPRFGKKFVFVLMPFREDYEDLYIYGIRGAVEKTGFVCRRADELEHNSDIIDEILYQIDRAPILIAEMTDKNPNVYYEVGIAHGKKKEVILLAKQGSAIPFDLSGKYFILYKNIRDLEKKLTRRLKTIADQKKNE
jgi:hypothetical protein